MEISQRIPFLCYAGSALMTSAAIERPRDRLVADLVLASEAFARKLRQQIRGNASEQPAFRRLA